jgi:hypothetical protein
MVQACTGVLFTHQRRGNMKNGAQFTLSGINNIGDLPTLGIHDFYLDKRAIKVYTPYAMNKSMYLPYGIDGPKVKIVGSHLAVADYTAWKEVYANDILLVKEFGYPSYAFFKEAPAQWWIDSIEVDTQAGWRQGSGIRYTINLDLYKYLEEES